MPGIARAGTGTSISTTIMPSKVTIAYLESKNGVKIVTQSLPILQIRLWRTVAFPKAQEGPWWDLLPGNAKMRSGSRGKCLAAANTSVLI